jgi:hypothetical protein
MMRVVQTKVHICEDRKLTIQLPADISAGEYEVVIVLDKCPQPSTTLEVNNETAIAENL